jgi:pterin-4a-carbinolamine dehydratase
MTSTEAIAITPSLKPERIGLTAALEAASPLKPERIGLRLRKLPGWELTIGAETGAQVVWRTFRFQRTETARAFADLAARIARDHGLRPVIAQCWNTVTVTVPGEGGVTETALDFVERLMLLPQGASAVEKEPQPEPANGQPAAVMS